ncbi:MAG: GAF domain-containing protein [Nitrospiraceae bacterium]|nr:GAF domain-containing protein [Nitrospiraceae bacterium]
MEEQTLRQFQDISALLNSSLDHRTILQRAIEAATVIMDAEAGSLLLLDETTGELYFDVAHGEKGAAVGQVRLRFGQGIAGHVMRTGEPVIVNDVQGDPRFFRHADQASGFVTRNMVCTPVTAHGRILGVLQAINRKHDGTFEEQDLQNFVALGHQVGIAIENANLYEEIQLLFEGFISASVQAIESRDPTTCGHSQRVATLTCQLAEVVNRVESGPYAGVCFNADQIKEIRYAAVLHDFGKVGVREHILVKARKLYPAQQEAIKARFDYIKRTLEVDTLKRKLTVYEAKERTKKQSLLAQFDQQLARRMEELDEMYSFILKCNQPAPSLANPSNRLKEIAHLEYPSFDGPRPYLTEDEVAALSVPEGSLTHEERKQIQRHVTHTFEFLSMIPWTRSLKHVPAIAWSHHEKLDGSGYPRGLSKDHIPIQSRMMTICDIYDALTTSDRPYKSAVSTVTAIQYLMSQVKEGKIDAALFELFAGERVYEATLVRNRKVA